MTDYADYQTPAANAVAIGGVSLTGTGLAKDTTAAAITTQIASGPNVLPTGAARSVDVTGVTTAVGTLHAAGHTIANELSTTGVPLLRNPTNAGNASALTVAGAGIATLLGSASILQPSFELAIQLKMPAAAGTLPFAELVFTWFDSASGLALGFDTYVLPCGNNVFVNGFLTGPMYGDTLQLQLTNLDPATTLTYNWTFTQTSHIYDRVRFIESNTAGVNGFTRPDVFPSAGVLGATNPGALAPGAPIFRLCSTWGGKARLAVDNIGQANAASIILVDPTGIFSTAVDGFYFGLAIAAGGVTSAEVSLPNGPLLMELINNGGAGNINISATLSREEY